MGPSAQLGKVVVGDSTGGPLATISANQGARANALILVHPNFGSQPKSAELLLLPMEHCTVVDHTAGEDGHVLARETTAPSRVQEAVATPSVRQDAPWEASAECDSARHEHEGMREYFEGEERGEGVRAQASHGVMSD